MAGVLNGQLRILVHSQDGLMLLWSLVTTRTTPEKCVSLDTSQTFSR